MPPQGYAILGGIAWNWNRARHGLPTISQFARKHKVVSVGVWLGATCWLIPHWLHD
jgi:hypothetical protein